MKCMHCYGYLVSFICMGTSNYNFFPQETCLQLGAISVASIAERFQKRVFQLSYRGCQFPFEIADYRGEVDLKMFAALKEAAAGVTGGLSCLRCESAILGEVVVGVILQNASLHSSLLGLQPMPCSASTNVIQGPKS